MSFDQVVGGGGVQAAEIGVAVAAAGGVGNDRVDQLDGGGGEDAATLPGRSGIAGEGEVGERGGGGAANVESTAVTGGGVAAEGDVGEGVGAGRLSVHAPAANGETAGGVGGVVPEGGAVQDQGTAACGIDAAAAYTSDVAVEGDVGQDSLVRARVAAKLVEAAAFTAGGIATEHDAGQTGGCCPATAAIKVNAAAVVARAVVRVVARDAAVGDRQCSAVVVDSATFCPGGVTGNGDGLQNGAAAGGGIQPTAKFSIVVVQTDVRQGQPAAVVNAAAVTTQDRATNGTRLASIADGGILEGQRACRIDLQDGIGGGRAAAGQGDGVTGGGLQEGVGLTVPGDGDIRGDGGKRPARRQRDGVVRRKRDRICAGAGGAFAGCGIQLRISVGIGDGFPQGAEAVVRNRVRGAVDLDVSRGMRRKETRHCS